MIDPAEHIITRKRKKYKFAKFANASNCYEYDEWLKAQPLDGEVRPVVCEIGAGTGLFSVELAHRHPENVYIALDVKADRLQKGAYLALDDQLDNVYFVRARADQIGELFAPNSLSAIWLTFSDPFPRPGSSGRRMTHPNFLKRYAQALSAAGGLYIKHDNPQFFSWTLEQLVGEKWAINELSFDLHESLLSDDYKIMTSYEQRWLDEGRTTSFVKTTKLN